jgi:hypothetical protein
VLSVELLLAQRAEPQEEGRLEAAEAEVEEAEEVEVCFRS